MRCRAWGGKLDDRFQRQIEKRSVSKRITWPPLVNKNNMMTHRLTRMTLITSSVTHVAHLISLGLRQGLVRHNISPLLYVLLCLQCLLASMFYYTTLITIYSLDNTWNASHGWNQGFQKIWCYDLWVRSVAHIPNGMWSHCRWNFL